MSLPLGKALVAILFYRGEAVTYDELAMVLSADTAEITSVIETVREQLQEFGLAIVENESSIELRTSAETSDLIERIRKEELSKDLGKAGLETLSIVLYRGPVTRADIDYIRGVNSTAILRNLLIRGLVEKIQNPEDQRSFLYRPSVELLSHLGIQSIRDLPEYGSIADELSLFEKSKDLAQEGERN